MNLNKTERGFDIANFKDRNGVECSLQHSSIATEDCIWLGTNNLEIKEFFPNSNKPFVNITKEELQQLKKRPQNEIYTSSRMHLTREQVVELLPYLQSFAETGSLY
jgi:hypothetical protein